MSHSSFPKHIGLIMDGNGRWARSRNQARTQGHLEGLKAAKRVVKAASDMGIQYLTLYTFSTENWKRAQHEVSFIMSLINKYLMAEFQFYRENNIRIRFTGDITGLSSDVAAEIQTVCKETSSFSGLTVVLAINHGGRDELVRAFKNMLQEGMSEDGINETSIQAHLDNPDIPDPDLIIRTASENRLSNFLIWEAAYSEYYISDKLWPDWGEDDLKKAVDVYQKRDRRFGGINT